MKLAKFLLCTNFNSALLTRAASNFNRQQLHNKTSEYLTSLKTNYFQNRTELEPTEWQNVRDCLVNNYKYINNDNVDSMIVGVCTEPQHLALAKSYIQYLTDRGTPPNDATLGKLLLIYNCTYHSRGGDTDSLPECEQAEIIRIYTLLKEKHEILNSTLCENLIFGLVATARWRDALELLNMIKHTSIPSFGAYSELAIKAFSVQDLPLGWSLLKEMIQHQKTPKCEVYLSFLKAILQNAHTFANEFEKFLEFLQKHDLVVTEKVASYIVELGSKYPTLLSVNRTHLKALGKCNACGLHMPAVSLSESDFQKLQGTFLKAALIGKDVFQKSTPAEVERFKNFVQQSGPYDCVIDGLNVAYSMGNKKPAHALANLLSAVVHYFVNQNKRVLVLGRAHMSKWPKKIMQFIYDNAPVFLTSDLSHDDPFLLYAALKSGQHTHFFSRDLMRQHAHLLGPELKNTFQRWQQEHQYSLITQTKGGKIIVKEPIRHSLSTQKVHDTWHLPCKAAYTPHTVECFEMPEHWLCVKIIK